VYGTLRDARCAETARPVYALPVPEPSPNRKKKRMKNQTQLLCLRHYGQYIHAAAEEGDSGEENARKNIQLMNDHP
jgi:hypothetical protein